MIERNDLDTLYRTILTCHQRLVETPALRSKFYLKVHDDPITSIDKIDWENDDGQLLTYADVLFYWPSYLKPIPERRFRDLKFPFQYIFPCHKYYLIFTSLRYPAFPFLIPAACGEPIELHHNFLLLSRFQKCLLKTFQFTNGSFDVRDFILRRRDIKLKHFRAGDRACVLNNHRYRNRCNIYI